jgi:transcriptional regulator with XRE-family HTH domain
MQPSEKFPPEIPSYNRSMPRTLRKVRPPQGARLLALRKAAGLSQADLGRRLGVPQGSIAFWEQSDKPPRSDLLPEMARILGASVEAILGIDAAHKRPGPVGRLQRLFDELRELPRKDQTQAADMLEFFVEKRRRRAG